MSNKLNLTLALIAGLLGGVACRYLMDTPVKAQVQRDKDGVLRVRGVIVEDENGHERVRLGAPLPDPMIHGVPHKRSGPISGLLISDANGNERGGYVTSDKSSEAFFTLDSEDDHLNLFDSKGNEADLSVFRDGPTFILKKEKQKVLEWPK